MANSGEVQRVAADLIAERFGDARIVSVNVGEDVDRDGEDMLIIRVVFEGKLDPKRAAGLIRHLRSRLHDISEERFPLLSFMTTEDAAEAA